ncbi:MAG: DUF1801 domain-containing protein [Gemmatimonadota bacterium]|nr:MAG: DUF1801 domain-containing protein [Gemmatimonadota bacterium]
MRSNATTVEEYIAELPDERAEAIRTVREAILTNLPSGFEETMNWGMITYQVPLETYPDTYNGKPLMYLALASQKHYMVVYLIGIYASEQARKSFEGAYRATGKPLDVGKSCVRFKRLDDLPLDLIGECVASETVGTFVARCKKA